MHPRSFLKLLLAVVFAVSRSVVDQAMPTHLIASLGTSPSGTPPPVDLLPHLDFSGR